MTLLRGDELRNEGKKKQSRLRVEHFGENPLTKGSRGGGLRCANEHFRISRANHADAKPNEKGGTRVFDGLKCHSGSSTDCGDAKGGGQNMAEPIEQRDHGGQECLT